MNINNLTKILTDTQKAFNNSQFLQSATAVQKAFNSSQFLQSATAVQKAFNNSPLLRSTTLAQKAFRNSALYKSLFEIQEILNKSEFNIKEAMNMCSEYIENLEHVEIDTSNENTVEEVEEVFFTKEEFEEQLKKIENSIIEQVKKNKPSIISFEGLMSMILTIFIFIYSYISASKFEEMNKVEHEGIESQISLINTSQERIYNLMLDHYKDLDDKSTFYVVERTVNLRLKPSTKSPIITTLYPNQRVKLENRKGKWIYIIYFDYLEQVTKTGWVYKKYLNKM